MANFDVDKVGKWVQILGVVIGGCGAIAAWKVDGGLNGILIVLGVVVVASTIAVAGAVALVCKTSNVEVKNEIDLSATEYSFDSKMEQVSA